VAPVITIITTAPIVLSIVTVIETVITTTATAITDIIIIGSAMIRRIARRIYALGKIRRTILRMKILMILAITSVIKALLIV
jgi:hypothetical protein